MNFSTLIGFIASVAVFISAVIMTFKNSGVLLDIKSVIIVLGGTVAASLICFPVNQVVRLLGVFFKRLIGTNKRNYNKLIQEIRELSLAHKTGNKNFEERIELTSDPFLKDAAKVLFWLRVDVNAEEMRTLLETRAATHYKDYMNDAQIFRTMSQFPPAFGLIGTTLGMIALLQSLGGGEDAKKLIGPAMAVALITTLYGLSLANFILIPISENLTKQTQEDQKARYMVIESIMLIQAGKPTKYVEEQAKSFLLPSQRQEEKS